MQWSRLYKTVKAKFGWAFIVFGFIGKAADWWGRATAVRDWAQYLPSVLRFLSEPWVTLTVIAVGVALIVWAALGRGSSFRFDARWLPEHYRGKEIPHEYVIGTVLILFLTAYGMAMHRSKTLPRLPLVALGCQPGHACDNVSIQISRKGGETRGHFLTDGNERHVSLTRKPLRVLFQPIGTDNRLYVEASELPKDIILGRCGERVCRLMVREFTKDGITIDSHAATTLNEAGELCGIDVEWTLLKSE